MISALLATISAAPMATPIPTPSIAPVVDSISVWDRADVIGSLVLGGAALLISIIALIVALAQQRKEVEMRKQEAKIAVIDKSYEIYNFFLREIVDDGYFSMPKDGLKYPGKQLARVFRIKYLANFLFNDKTFKLLNIELQRIIVTISSGVLPNITDMNKDYSIQGAIEDDFDIFDPTYDE